MANKLYVGNFPWATTEAELTAVFAQYGELKSLKIISDRETGRSRGFAFIEFADPEAVQEAMDVENERDFGGRKLMVREAIDKARGSRDDTRPSRQMVQAPQDPAPDRSNGNTKRSRENRPPRREDRYRD